MIGLPPAEGGTPQKVACSFMQMAVLSCPFVALGGGHCGSGQFEGWLGSMLGIESLAVLIWLSLT